MTRWLFFFLFALMVAANFFFDLAKAPKVFRMTNKIEKQANRDESVVIQIRDLEGKIAISKKQEKTLIVVIRYVLWARFSLTALPLFLLFYFGLQRRLSDEILATAITISAVVFSAKSFIWLITSIILQSSFFL